MAGRSTSSRTPCVSITGLLSLHIWSMKGGSGQQSQNFRVSSPMPIPRSLRTAACCGSFLVAAQDGSTEKEDTDIWFVRMSPQGPGLPQRAKGPINSAADEWYPTVTQDGWLYFGSERPGGYGGSDLYRCKLQAEDCTTVENLGPAVNSPEEEYEPTVSPNGHCLIFMAARRGSKGRTNIYLAEQTATGWGNPIPLEVVNSTSSEYAPRFSSDGHRLYFSSSRAIPRHVKQRSYAEILDLLHAPGNGLLGIYSVPVTALPATCTQ
jgi:WD40-like Beta Propeller Repeat